MTTSIELPLPSVRRLYLERQQLAGAPRWKCSPEGLLGLIERLGFVQVDSIQTVARAHHMILFARNQCYQPKNLTRLLERDRSLFEHWTHDASIIPTAFYPYWQHRFRRERESLRERWKDWHDSGFENVLEDVLKTVEQGGRAMSRDFKRETPRASEGWWDWHDEKTALEYLWRTGELAIAGREGFQKIYDVARRVIPDHHRESEVREAEFVDWTCRAALERLGVATPGEISRFWDLISIDEATKWCEARSAEGELRTVQISDGAGAANRPSYGFVGVERQAADAAELPDRIRVLSPFDPLIRDRKRCQRLFGFDYRIEVFVPAAKRRYGYYVFPLLEGERLIGRIDMKKDAKAGALSVSGLWLEPGVKFGRGRRERLEAELDRQARFIGVDKVGFADDFLKEGG